MNYPLISEYIEAIRSAEDNFDKLSNLRPVLDSNGNPIMSSGNFAVVFKMKDIVTDRLFAVKCFIKNQEGRSERYAKIADELQYVSSPYILHVRYLEREFFVDSANCDEEEFPVLVMDWVNGQPLDAYLRQHLDDTYDLQMLAYSFCRMGAWLLSQPFAHGDLKPDNILVRDDGTLVLVDYDGMFVPSMEGETAMETGSPDFRHPLRTEQSFNEHIDDFSIATIALSLKAISLNPQLFHQYAASDRLLFSASDYLNIGQSPALKDIVSLSSNAELATILAAFHLAMANNDLSMVSFRIFMFNKPEKKVITLLSTDITDEERKNAIEDDYGVKYTADGLKLIRAPHDITAYIIKKGTQVIGKGAFLECSSLQSITIPNSVTNIGDSAFRWCLSLKSITIPNSVTNIGDSAFEMCLSLQSITIPNSVTSIGDGAFRWCSSLQSITIPNSVINIGKFAFERCSSLQSITIPNSVISIGERAFEGCSALQSITIPNSVTSIGDATFNECYSLRKIVLNNSKYFIHGQLLLRSDGHILSCWSKATNINISNSVISIGNRAFAWCSSLESITIPNSVTSIGDWAFEGCSSLQSITIPNSVTSIGDCAFEGCSALQSITIPNSVTSIGDCAFEMCLSLQSITIPNSVTSIGDCAFLECSSLQSITIPHSVINIGKEVFYNCTSLKEIRIMKGSRTKVLKLLGGKYEDKLVEI